MTLAVEHGDLREWIQEKTNGAVPSDTVICRGRAREEVHLSHQRLVREGSRRGRRHAAAHTVGSEARPGARFVVAGSYVARTTAQIDRLVEARRASPVEISVPLLLSESTHREEVRRVTRAVSDFLARGV